VDFGICRAFAVEVRRDHHRTPQGPAVSFDSMLTIDAANHGKPIQRWCPRHASAPRLTELSGDGKKPGRTKSSLRKRAFTNPVPRAERVDPPKTEFNGVDMDCEPTSTSRIRRF